MVNVFVSQVTKETDVNLVSYYIYNSNMTWIPRKLVSCLYSSNMTFYWLYKQLSDKTPDIFMCRTCALPNTLCPSLLRDFMHVFIEYSGIYLYKC